VIFHAAGDSGAGVFEAAASMSDELDRQLWAIGVDTDQYVTAPELPGAVRAAAWRPHILTSVVKELDQAVYLALKDVAEDRFVSGPTGYDLASGLLNLSYSGGFIDAIRPTIESYRQSIIDGVIDVPCVPDDRLAQAAELGISPEDCGGR
jgi:basic membrane protein A